MPVICNIGDWFSLRPGNTYRKFELYSLDWPLDVDLDFMNIYGAPFGGPIALVRDSTKFVKIQGMTKPVIKVFNSSGKVLSTIHWKHGKLLTLGWSDSEDLICVQEDGLVYIYDMFGEEKRFFSMGKDVSYIKIIDAKVFQSSAGTGVAVMTTSFQVYLINNVHEPKNRQLPELPKSMLEPNAWDIVTEDRNSYCIIARGDTVYKLLDGQRTSQEFTHLIEKPYKFISKISISYNQNYLAIYTNNGILWLGTTDLQTKFCEFDTGRTNDLPKQIEWITDPENSQLSDAVVITYSSLLLVINTKGDQNMFTYDPEIHIIPEMDGVRIITNSSHEMIQKVPKCVQNIFAINSQEPSSFLFEANKKFEQKSHQSDEYLSLFRDKMESAIDECITAAGYEFDTETQKCLIKTAYFGKGFVQGHNPDNFMRMCRILRVLNALRHENVSMPLTYNQFNFLRPNVILDRLVFRKHYAIAIQIAKHLKLPESKILEHWAIHKVLYDRNDEEVARKITEKFKNPTIQGISFCKIAEKSHLVGRDKLAIKLLELEPRASLQVPLLLKLGESEKALINATESGNTDLVMRVLLQLRETTTLAKFQLIIRDIPIAFSLYKKYCQQYSKASLQDCFNLVDDFQSQAEYYLREAIEKNNVESSLLEVKEAFNKARCDIEKELCSETKKLYNTQKNLSEKNRNTVNFYELPVNDTIRELLKLGELKEAEKIRVEYKIPERRFWWLRIQILADQYRWDELEKLSKTKKSPVGYEPFVEVCLNKNNIEEAKKYLPKCKKAKWYIKAGLYDEASTVAFEQKDLNSLLTIQMIAGKNGGNQQLTGKLETYIAQLSAK